MGWLFCWIKFCRQLCGWIVWLEIGCLVGWIRCRGFPKKKDFPEPLFVVVLFPFSLNKKGGLTGCGGAGKN